MSRKYLIVPGLMALATFGCSNPAATSRSATESTAPAVGKSSQATANKIVEVKLSVPNMT